MAGSLNKVTIIGHLGDDPEIKTLNNGNLVANFSVATSESWKDKVSGEKKERTEWHRCVVWNEGLVGVIESYVRKGMKVYVEGQLQTRKWQDQDGKDRYSTEIILTGFDAKLLMLDKGKGGDRDQGNSSDRQEDKRGGYGEQSGGGRQDQRGNMQRDLDDEIPSDPGV